MENKTLYQIKESRQLGEAPLPEYVSPTIVTYTSEQIMEQVGPAQACTSGVCSPVN